MLRSRERAVGLPPVLVRWGLGPALLVTLLGAHRTVAATPATATTPLMPLARIFDLVMLVMALILAHAAGARALRRFGLASGPVEGAAFATALGLGMGAYAALALGLVGLYRAPVLLAVTLAATAILRHDLVATTRGLAVFGACLRRAARESAPGMSALAALLSLTVLLATLGALTPPHHWDPLAYHLAAPQRWLLTGWIRPLPGIEWSNLPLTAELLYGVGLAFGGAVFGQLLHLAFAGIAAAALWALACRHFDRPTGWLALAVFLSTPLVPVWARVADIDLALACFVLLAIAAALRAATAKAAGESGGRWGERGASARTESRRWLALAGIFAGLALGSKYQALGAVAPLGLTILVDGLWRRSARDPAPGGDRGWGRDDRRGMRAALGDAAIFGLAATLVASPWYLKNWILLGNPIWPLFFGGRDFSPLALELTNYYLRGMTLSPRTLSGYLTLPLQAYARGDFEQRYVILSPLYLLLPLLAALPGLWRRALVYPLAVAAGFTAGWVVGFQELRYLLPVCAPLSLATACVLRAAWGRSRLRALVRPALLLSSLLTLVLVGLHVGADRPVAILLGRESLDAYLRHSPSYRATQHLAARLGPGERAIFFNEAQLYYLPPTLAVQPDHLNLNLLALTEAHPDPADALAHLQAEGVDYLLVYEANIRFWRRFDPEGRLGRGQATFERLAPRLEPVYRDDDPEGRPIVTIYRVPAIAGSRAPSVAGAAERAGQWSR